MTQPIRPIVVTIVIVIRVILAVAINQAHDLLWIHISAAFGSSFQQLLAPHKKSCQTFGHDDKKFRQIRVKSSQLQPFICCLNGPGIFVFQALHVFAIGFLPPLTSRLVLWNFFDAISARRARVKPHFLKVFFAYENRAISITVQQLLLKET